ncbi:MAG: hypothetical protein M1829_005319 [Trizodia sp. TS-e1964]|nr:MAG: hypothetical protein M1829_005319 [Trizodia sp. TS-e1964]
MSLIPGTSLCGQSGRTYTIQEVLHERRVPLLISVFRARYDLNPTIDSSHTVLKLSSAEGESFVIKSLLPGEYTYQQDMQKHLASCPNLRTMIDGVPRPELLIYPFLETDVLQFSRKKLTKATRRSMLKGSLAGLAALHDRNILHSDIKPNNILLDYEETDGAFSIKKAQISDLEDALWRSPESWARAHQGTESDIFSFGVVSVYIMLNDMVLRASEVELAAEDAWRYVLRRQISYFGDNERFKGLLKWIGEVNTFFERLIDLTRTFNMENSRKPIRLWHFVDAQFRDLVCKMTSLNPAKRITAREALEHPWFAQSD